MDSFRSLKNVSALRDSVTTDEALAVLGPAVPKSFSLKDVLQEVAGAQADLGPRRTLLIILACLEQDDKLLTVPGESEFAGKLAEQVARAIAPIHVKKAEGSQYEEENIQECLSITAGKIRPAAEAGLRALRLLAQKLPGRLDDAALLTTIAFADESEPWATEATSKLASELLTQQLDEDTVKRQFIAEAILRDYLRPLFSKSRPATVTASGRKAEYIDPERQSGLPDDSRKTKPWKYEDLRAIPVLSWAVEAADEELVSQHWPLFIPVLLTLADDSTTQVRARGLEILARFLAKFPGKKLQDTGLATVFEQAVLPTLLYLPALTPVDESLQLLEPAYAALLALADRLRADESGKQRTQLLGKLLREGVFTGYFHAREHVRIVNLLFRQAACIVTLMGINSVKHLKDLIPMVVAIMTDPFGPASPATLYSALVALQAVLANAWPRLSDSPWREEILKALVFCWLNVRSDENPGATGDRAKLESELVKTASMLSAVTKTAQVSLATLAAPLVSREPSLAPLFADSS